MPIFTQAAWIRLICYFEQPLEVTLFMLHSAALVKPLACHRLSTLILYGTFIFGFLTGYRIPFSEADHYVALVRCAASSPTSAIGLLATIVFTFSLTALIYAAGKTRLFPILCFVQAFAFGIASGAVYCAYGASQWLICLLLLFTGTVNLICLLWFWSRHVSAHGQHVHRDFTYALSVSAIAAVLDHIWISPLLEELLL